VTPARRRALRLAAGALLPALSGCGFRLRGSGSRPAASGRVYVDGDRATTIARPLSDALRERGFAIADNRDEADVLLRLIDERIDERVVSVQSTGRVSELELIHAVDLVVVESFDGAPPFYDPALPSNRVRVAREYTYDETQVLGKANEERTLRAELRAELVRQIVLRTIASGASAG